MTDIVKVRAASVDDDGERALLRLRTEEDIDVTFELNEVSLALLSLTVTPAVKLALSRLPATD